MLSNKSKAYIVLGSDSRYYYKYPKYTIGVHIEILEIETKKIKKGAY